MICPICTKEHNKEFNHNYGVQCLHPKKSKEFICMAHHIACVNYDVEKKHCKYFEIKEGKKIEDCNTRNIAELE